MSVAISYAKALMQVVVESKATSLLESENQLNQVVQAIKESPALKKVLIGLAVSRDERLKVVEAISQKMNLSPLIQKFLLLLTRKQRLGSLTQIQDALKDLRLESEGVIRGKLVSADALSESELKEISSSFEKRLNKKIYFDCETNTDLIAGFSITLNGVTYDGSLSSQLRQIRSQMLN